MDFESVLRLLVIVQFTALALLRLGFKWLTGTVAEAPRVDAEGWPVVVLRMGLTLPLVALVLLYTTGRPEAGFLAVPLPGWLRLFGAPIALGALLLLAAAHRALDGYFSTTLRLREDHHLVDFGPYAWVRHPIYVAYLLFFAAAFLLSANAGIGGLGIAVILSLVTLRLPREEALLRERFGDAWDRYAAATGRLVPRAERLRGLLARAAAERGSLKG